MGTARCSVGRLVHRTREQSGPAKMTINETTHTPRRPMPVRLQKVFQRLPPPTIICQGGRGAGSVQKLAARLGHLTIESYQGGGRQYRCASTVFIFNFFAMPKRNNFSPRITKKERTPWAPMRRINTQDNTPPPPVMNFKGGVGGGARHPHNERWLVYSSGNMSSPPCDRNIARRVCPPDCRETRS